MTTENEQTDKDLMLELLMEERRLDALEMLAEMKKGGKNDYSD